MTDAAIATRNAITELRDLLSRARAAVDRLELAEPSSESGPEERPRESERLRRELDQSQEETRLLATQLGELERRIHQLLSLYVATYQLYAARSPEAVCETIAEIARDLLGAERFVLLLRVAGTGECRVALVGGASDPSPGPWSREIYRGGQPQVDAALEQGLRHFSPDSSPVAVVPLQFDNLVVGALVIEELLGHKRGFVAGDEELLDLLAAHAASALKASESFAVASRKLHTLESLIQLARGGA